MKELVLMLALLQPKADSICHRIQMQYIHDAGRYGIVLEPKWIEFNLITTFSNDTIATSWEEDNISYVDLDLGYFVSLIDEPGRFATLVYHELSHIYLDLDDIVDDDSIMNYNYIAIDLYNEKERYYYLNKLFKK